MSFARLQRVLPQHGLSRVAGALARSETPLIAATLIRLFARRYRVDLTDAEASGLDAYSSFNAFFTRLLKPGARPMPADPAAIAAPAEGFISQHGALEGDRLVQAKGQRYSVASLVHDPAVARWLEGGKFATIYLSPRDYHRVHAPVDGRLEATVAIPGQLFSVNAVTEASISELFCRNERLVCVFDRYVLVLVGALIVASIVPAFEGPPPSPYRQLARHCGTPIEFRRGDEVGRFQVGSTAIVLFPPGAAELAPTLAAGQPVRLGAPLGVMRDRPET